MTKRFQHIRQYGIEVAAERIRRNRYQTAQDALERLPRKPLSTDWRWIARNLGRSLTAEDKAAFAGGYATIANAFIHGMQANGSK
jgi:hypothetical protein